jgi:hypothetical protein
MCSNRQSVKTPSKVGLISPCHERVTLGQACSTPAETGSA